jgi:hypothetical protein
VVSHDARLDVLVALPEPGAVAVRVQYRSGKQTRSDKDRRKTKASRMGQLIHDGRIYTALGPGYEKNGMVLAIRKTTMAFSRNAQEVRRSCGSSHTKPLNFIGPQQHAQHCHSQSNPLLGRIFLP